MLLGYHGVLRLEKYQNGRLYCILAIILHVLIQRIYSLELKKITWLIVLTKEELQVAKNSSVLVDISIAVIMCMRDTIEKVVLLECVAPVQECTQEITN